MTTKGQITLSNTEKTAVVSQPPWGSAPWLTLPSCCHYCGVCRHTETFDHHRHWARDWGIWTSFRSEVAYHARDLRGGGTQPVSQLRLRETGRLVPRSLNRADRMPTPAWPRLGVHAQHLSVVWSLMHFQKRGTTSLISVYFRIRIWPCTE